MFHHPLNKKKGRMFGGISHVIITIEKQFLIQYVVPIKLLMSNQYNLQNNKIFQLKYVPSETQKQLATGKIVKFSSLFDKENLTYLS